MPNNWKRRLGISISVIWLLLCIDGYLMDSYMDLRTKISGIMLFGITPIVVGWFAWWVLDGFKRNR